MKKIITLFLIWLCLFAAIVSVQAQDDPQMDLLKKIVYSVLETHSLPLEFEKSSIQMSASSLANLRKHAELLKPLPADTVIEIGVYLQNTGNENTALQLTQQRAEKVKRELIKLGVSPNMLIAKGYGTGTPTNANYPDNQVEYIIRKSDLVMNYQKSQAEKINSSESKPQESKIAAGKGWDKVIIGASQSEVEAVLGKPDYSGNSGGDAVASYYKKGVVVVYESGNMRVKTLRFIGDGSLYGATSVTFQSFQGKPDKNLMWGASVSQVSGAYGEPTNRESHEDFKTKLEIVNLIYPGAVFIFKGNKLFQINVMAGEPKASSTAAIPKLSTEERNELGKQLRDLAKVKDIDPQIIRDLIKKGADIDYNEGVTPLVNAIDYERTEVAKILLEAGANPNLASGQYKTTPLVVAIQTRNFEMVKLLVEKYKANVNHQTSSGRSPLIVAAEFNYDDKITTFLIANGADPNLVNSYNKNALTIARERKQEGIVNVLAKVTSERPVSSTNSSSSNSSSSENRNTNSSSGSNRNSALAQEAQEEYEKLYSRLQELDNLYNKEVQKIQRQIEKDRKSGVQANLFMNAERRRAQSYLDEAHRIIKAFLKKYRRVLSDDSIETLEDWDDRLPTYISV